jgi:hypothetical protein
MHQLPELTAQATHTAFSTLMWSISLLLECTLFVALFSRRIAPFVPFFTNFVGFYLVRSTLLFLILNPISPNSYSWLYRFLLLFDALVQFGVAAEITRHLILNHGGWISRNITVPIVFLCAAALGTYLTTALTPHRDVQIEASVMFFSFYMLFLYGWMIALQESSVTIRNIGQGFAIYGVINIIASVGRTMAAFAGHPSRYLAWTYVLAGTYVVVVIFWLGTLKLQPENVAPKPLKTTI